MKKLFKPACILLYLLTIPVFFLVGLYVAQFVGAGKNQMLAGGAIVFFYGLISAFSAFIIAIFMAIYMDHHNVIKINKFLGISFLLLVLFTVYRVQMKKKEDAIKSAPHNSTTSTQEIAHDNYQTTAPPVNAPSAISKPPVVDSPILINDKLGVGFFKPDFIEFPVLYFYGGVNLGSGQLSDYTPQDSVIFGTDQHNSPTTTYAPPWLYPQHLKLDYGIFIFKTLGVGRDFVKVESNRSTRQITYLDKSSGTFMDWSAFLLSVNSVEFIDHSTQTVHIKALQHAAQITTKFDFMQPILIEEDWMYVKMVDQSFEELGKGWIRWKDGNQLLITYSLLS